MQNRHALCMCIEKAMGVEVSPRVQYIRTIMDELQRIDSHILFFSCLCQDLGATTAFLYGLPRPREGARHLRGDLRRTPHPELQHHRAACRPTSIPTS